MVATILQLVKAQYSALLQCNIIPCTFIALLSEVCAQSYYARTLVTRKTSTGLKLDPADLHAQQKYLRNLR
jgi:hypothetical protein